MPKYVQHKSGQWEKWKVRNESSGKWIVENSQTNYVDELWLPKSEYVEVPAPEQWVDVSANCEVATSGITLIHKSTIVQGGVYGYRLHKIPICTGSGIDHEATKQWAFIIEKRVQP